MVKQEDVEYMISEGIGDYLSMRKNQFLDSFSFDNFPKLLFSFYKKFGKFVVTIAKSITTFIILSKIYDTIGIEKFGILMLSGYLAMQIGKNFGEEEKK